MFNLSKNNVVLRGKENRQQRNICIVLGVLAEKLSGPSSVAILTPGTLSFLIANLVSKKITVFVFLKSTGRICVIKSSEIGGRSSS